MDTPPVDTQPIIAVLGPTASGKSRLGMGLARHFKGEIVSADSMQVYRGMDIGTAKPTRAEQAEIPHHMIDVVDPEADYTVAEFQSAGRGHLADLAGRNRRAVIVGGSGLYFRSLVDPFRFPPYDRAVRDQVRALSHEEAVAELLASDPSAGDQLDLANPRRVGRAVEIIRLGGETPTERAKDPRLERVRGYEPEIPFVAIGLDPGDLLAERVGRRIDQMLGEGLLDEVAGLAGRLGLTASSAVGYSQLLPVVAGTCTLDEGQKATVRATMSLARKQRTFFRRDPRIRWLEWDPDPSVRESAAHRVIEEMCPWSS
ncbi:MAG: tRNA (adenosine(37)-N6)-dimethylallyltransferase MiaA [bacterium]|nr:tRNA (adenosine(37)-N6)-dimethylallyltransferase MiaA [bacterium]MDE0643921.1 tRNA (adenosine(37)-N6)-dimethylallyltransferase MiaA [bacterium]